ncbi:GntR family transcriptional regulator, partial [Listeria monocytogenes]|nr:GntR family transcriptional regulator [Listeria monocytogenes]
MVKWHSKAVFKQLYRERGESFMPK